MDDSFPHDVGHTPISEFSLVFFLLGCQCLVVSVFTAKYVIGLIVLNVFVEAKFLISWIIHIYLVILNNQA